MSMPKSAAQIEAASREGILPQESPAFDSKRPVD
jgi:hypothetical protein